MISPELLQRYTEFVHITLLLFAAVMGFRYARHRHDNLWLIFYTLAVVTSTLSELYWVAHEAILGFSVRIPFAANDVAEFGQFLLLSSALHAAVDGRMGRPAWVTAAAAAFSAANVALWLAWSGEWVRDILGGISFGYFVCTCACALQTTKALSRGEWCALGLASLLILTLQGMDILAPEPWSSGGELAGYILLAAVTLWFLIRCLLSLKRGTGTAMTLSFSGCCWTCVFMYMSDRAWFALANALELLFELLLFLAVREKARRTA